jgi:excisionase family DNA binding protein
MSARFLTKAEVADELNISDAQLYALIRRGEIRHIKVGGRGVQRIERSELELYIQRAYEETARWIEEHPFAEGEGPQPPSSRKPSIGPPNEPPIEGSPA